MDEPLYPGELDAAARAITNLARIGRGIRLSNNEARELARAALIAAAVVRTQYLDDELAKLR
jgi:hypothetical protein